MRISSSRVDLSSDNLLSVSPLNVSNLESVVDDKLYISTSTSALFEFIVFSNSILSEIVFALNSLILSRIAFPMVDSVAELTALILSINSE